MLIAMLGFCDELFYIICIHKYMFINVYTTVLFAKNVVNDYVLYIIITISDLELSTRLLLSNCYDLYHYQLNQGQEAVIF